VGALERPPHRTCDVAHPERGRGPWSLIHCKDYPETSAQGFFWITAQDFHAYFDTIFECRLVNSGDVSIKGMPSPRSPGMLPPLLPGMMMGMMPPMGPGPGGGVMGGPGQKHLKISSEEARVPAMPWFEWMHANPGEITHHNQPEFTILVPQNGGPCEVICCVEQMDPRMSQTKAMRAAPIPLLVKVYENVDGQGQCFSKDLVCKSNWIPVRDSMVAFSACRGGQFKVVVELPNDVLDAKSSCGQDVAKVDRMIFRCYSQHPNLVVSAGTASFRHMLVSTPQWHTPSGMRWTFVGAIKPSRYQNGEIAVNEPEPLDRQHDSLRKAEFDQASTLVELAADVKEDCTLM